MSIASPRLNRLPLDQRGLTIADFLLPIRVGERMGTRLRHLALVALGTIVIIASARVSIPLPFTPVPITGQTFGVLLVSGALGFRRSVLSVGMYVALGLVGLPIFAQGTSGTTIVFGATGGYIVGFLIAGPLVGRLAELGWDRKIVGALGAMAIGNVVIYLVGVPWLMAVTHHDLAWGIANGLTPFVVVDVIKLILAAAAFPAAWWIVGRRAGEG